MKGFARVAAAVPLTAIADPAENAARTLALWREADERGANVVVFPELGLSGYTIRDLVLNGALLDAVETALLGLVEHGRELAALALVGVPLRAPHGLYNCAAAISGGELLGLVPKSYLPNYREFEEARWYRPGTEIPPGTTLRVGELDVPLGTDLLFEATLPGLAVGVEICEDLWVQSPPSSALASAGATVIANLSASNFTIGKAEIRRNLALSQSDRGKCAYVYVAAGPGESSTDLTWDADAFVCENGNLLAESTRFAREGQLVVQDVDLEGLAFERRSTVTFGDCAARTGAAGAPFRRPRFEAAEPAGLVRTVSPTPFLPRDEATLATRCWEMFEIQSNALAKRMRAIGEPKLVLGVSGGLDSTNAALVCAAALDLEGRPREDLVCVTMPGFGTSEGTQGNGAELVRALGGTRREIPIGDASRTVLEAVGHPAAEGVSTAEELVARLRDSPEHGDVTLENVQARLRTLLLMTIANGDGGIVVGTGDLSEKALGWSTYSGDHIAMYDVNAGVPKTLLQFVIRWVANQRARTWSESESLKATLYAILDTPISPELLPADAEGRIAQLTEDTLGPYELHDFFLFHFVRFGARPGRILDLASVAFEGRYDAEELAKWCRKFVWRFFTQQFKRSCTADGPKVGTVALSPRGDWRMPSDARADAWLWEIETWVADTAGKS